MSPAAVETYAAFRQRLTMSAALAALMIGALMLAGCDRPGDQLARKEQEKPTATTPPASTDATTEAAPAEADEPADAMAAPNIAGATGRSAYMPLPAPAPMPQPEVRDRYENTKPNPVKLTQNEPVSTFSADVDTASYAVIRKYLTDGTLPPRDAVRIEEMVNYFDYHYELPSNRAQPFRPNSRVAWQPSALAYL